MAGDAAAVWMIAEEIAAYTKHVLERHYYHVANHRQLGQAIGAWRHRQMERGTPWQVIKHALPSLREWDIPIPELVIARLDQPFAPDFLDCGEYWFVSERLLAALALPNDAAVAEVRPARVIHGPPEADGRGYRWLHVAAEGPALDLERSGMELRPLVLSDGKLVTDPTDRVIERPSKPRSLALRAGFVPQHDLVRCAPLALTSLATDDLARRVLASGCTNMEFRDLATAIGIREPRRIRTGGWYCGVWWLMQRGLLSSNKWNAPA